MRLISTDKAPTPAGHYSQAVEHAGVVYVAGVLPIDASGTKHLGEIEAQAGVVLDNLAVILSAAGSGLDRLLRVTVYITEIGLWGRFNAFYAGRMGAHKPARTVVPVPTLHHGFLIELDAIAATDGDRR